MRDLAREGVPDTRARRSDANADAVRRVAEQEALKVTEEYCADLRAQAEQDLGTAQKSLASVERLKGDIEAEYYRARRVRDEADSYSANLVIEANVRASELQSETELESARIISEAQTSTLDLTAESQNRVDEIIVQAYADAEKIRDEIQAETAGEIKSLIADVEVARSKIEEELEAQRLLTEAARIRATPPGIVAKAATAEFEEPVALEIVAPAKAEKKKPTHRKATAGRAKKAA